MSTPIALSPDVAAKAVKAAYQVKVLTDEAARAAKQMDNTLPHNTVLHQLIDQGQLDAQVAAKVLGKLYQLKVVNPDESELDPHAIRKLPKEFIQRNQMVPLSLDGKNLRVVVADPTRANLQAQVADLSSCNITLCLTPVPVMQALLDSNAVVNSIDAPKESKPEKVEPAAEPASITNSGFALRRRYKIDDGEAVVDFVQDILMDAIQYDVSDIHIEPYRRTARMRWRLDGVMQEQNQYQPFLVANYAAVMARLKLMAGCDISERRLPQDGAITITYQGEEVDFRFNIVPTKYGERPVLRKLQGTPDLTLDKLGFFDEDYAKIQDAIRSPQGMVLVTGPTGSGKSTTLFACLQEINRPETNILTAEDPVEYYLEGVGQVQANDNIGLTFASILRAFLRQDPEIILVGEIRDKETVDISVKAALTGHLLLSTLHTNDAVGTVVRLLNMGVPNFMISSALTLIVAQRLARKNCTGCLVPDPAATPENLVKIGFSPEDAQQVQAYKGEGCQRCGGSGYKGRQGIYEVMKMNKALEAAILNDAQAPELLAAAKSTGFNTMQEIARDFVVKKVMSIEEYIRVLALD
ncbi:MAG: GspE/PulE family protein [Litorivicinus sp.]